MSLLRQQRCVCVLCWRTRLQLQWGWKTKPGASGIKQARNKHRLCRIQPSHPAFMSLSHFPFQWQPRVDGAPRSHRSFIFSASSDPLHRIPHDPCYSRCFLKIYIQLPPLGARVPCLDPLPRRHRTYLLILRTSGDPRRAGGVQPGTQLLQARLPARLQLHGVSVKDGRWGLGAAQRRHFKLRETEWKIIEGNAGCGWGQEGETETQDGVPKPL